MPKVWTDARIYPAAKYAEGATDNDGQEIDGEVRIKPPHWEQAVDADSHWGVSCFRWEASGEAYEVMLTSRPYISTQLESSKNDPDVRERAFTLTLFGSMFVDYLKVGKEYLTASAGRTFRWREGEHINGETFRRKLGMSHGSANNLLLLVKCCGHSASLVVIPEVDHD